MQLPTFESLAEKPRQTTLVVVGLTLFVVVVAKLISKRLYIRRLKHQGLPMPPHSLLFGHLPILAQVTKLVPSDANPMYLPTFVRQQYPELGPNYYLDLWPLAPSMLMVGSPSTVDQVSNKYAMDKNFLLRNFLRPLTDGLDMVSMNGAPWKKWRSIFNPGFSSAHLMKLVPSIIQEIEIFCSMLDKQVPTQDIFPLKPLTDNLILDVIGQVVLDVQFGCQTQHSEVVQSLRTQINWLHTESGQDLWKISNIVRPFVHWYHGGVVNRYITQKLAQRIKAWQQNPSDLRKNRTIVDLAIVSYVESGADNGPAVIDQNFQKGCMSQIKIFLYAGHDTTSPAICQVLWLLSQNPKALAALRREHNDVFGSDPSQAASAIAKSPHMVSQLPYTTAVLKETLRLFPSTTSSRKGDRNINLTDEQGRVFPTKGMVVWSNQASLHYDKVYWHEPYLFIPERYLVGPEDSMYPVKGMWRPFEHGPRNCLGQELATLEIKILLVLVSRTYDFRPAYDELDARKGGKQLAIFGMKAYQVEKFQPRDNLPIRIQRINHGSK